MSDFQLNCRFVQTGVSVWCLANRRNDDITVEEAERSGISMLKTAGQITRGAVCLFP